MSTCCINCFEDEVIIKLIADNGYHDDCEYCKTSDTKCISVYDLTEQFRKFLSIYEETAYGEHYGQDDNPLDHGEPLHDLIQEDWNIFSYKLEREIQRRLLFDILDLNHELDTGGRYSLYSRYEDSFTHVDSEEIWDEFSEGLKFSNRFFPVFDWVDDFAELFIELKRTIASGSTFFRARIGSEMNAKRQEVPFSLKNMGAPPIDKTRNGRANPVGIPYLYLATNRETSISEVRPWKEAKVSVAEVSIIEPVKIIDITNVPPITSPFENTDLRKAIENRILLSRLSYDLAKPINPNAGEYEYIPTQYLSELIKHLGYEGIKYKSAMGDGCNLVLFNENKVRISNVELIVVDNIVYSIR